jgi:hypothetical protein
MAGAGRSSAIGCPGGNGIITTTIITAITTTGITTIVTNGGAWRL